MPYATLQAIREGSGLLLQSDNETPSGDIDGSNNVFTTVRRPLVDSNNDDIVDEDDVVAFVDGEAVAVSAVDAKDGTITLEAAPAADSQVTVSYYFSPISDSYVGGKQDEAESWVNLKIKGYVKVPLNPIPGIISTAAEMYAAGLILTRDWGSRADSEMTSKDGYQKLKTARDLIADYIQGLIDDKATTNQTGGDQNAVSTVTDRDVFSRHQDELRPDRGYGDPFDEDFFMTRH